MNVNLELPKELAIRPGMKLIASSYREIGQGHFRISYEFLQQTDIPRDDEGNPKRPQDRLL